MGSVVDRSWNEGRRRQRLRDARKHQPLLAKTPTGARDRVAPRLVTRQGTGEDS